VRVAVAAELVAAALDLTHEPRVSFRHPAEHEEGRGHTVAIELVEQTERRVHHPGGEGGPVLRSDETGKRLHVEVLLDVEGQRVPDRVGHG